MDSGYMGSDYLLISISFRYQWCDWKGWLCSTWVEVNTESRVLSYLQNSRCRSIKTKCFWCHEDGFWTITRTWGEDLSENHLVGAKKFLFLMLAVGLVIIFLLLKPRGVLGGTYKLTNNIIVRNTFRSLSHCPRSYCVYFVIHRILFSTLR